MSFMYYSLVVRNRLGECFTKRERATRLIVAMVKEVEGFLEFVSDELLLGRFEAVKQATRDILRAALTLDDAAYETASKAWGRAYNRAAVYTMCPEDFGKRPPTITYLGGRRYQLDEAPAVVLARIEHMVVQAFLRSDAKNPDKVLEKPELLALSGVDDAPRILKNLKRKYPATLGLAIHLPRRKGMGGYRLRLRRA